MWSSTPPYHILAFLPHYTINKSLWFSSPSDAETEKLCSTKNVATSDMLYMKGNNDDDDSACQLPSSPWTLIIASCCCSIHKSNWKSFLLSKLWQRFFLGIQYFPFSHKLQRQDKLHLTSKVKKIRLLSKNILKENFADKEFDNVCQILSC